MENRVSEILTAMCLLKGLNHRTVRVNTNVFLTDIENVVNNYIISVDNCNWKLLMNGGTLFPVGSFNISARLVGGKIGMLFDIIFCHPSDKILTKNKLYARVVTLYQDLMKKLKKEIKHS